VFLLVAIVLLIFLPSPWNVVGLVVGIVLFGGEVLFWNRRVRAQRVRSGVDILVGETGIVLSPCRPDGQVQLRGEIWEAHCNEGANSGDEVVVRARDGLTLIVERA
jgi:membrane-bound serine protease (ClpP class)